MPIKFTRPGVFTTIQDLGRYGYRANGIGPGGAMDTFAASVANLLVGNNEKLPVLEMHFPAPEIFFEEDAVVSITGGNFSGYIDAEPMPSWTPVFIKKSSSLSFKKFVSGARGYLAIQGGIKCDNWLGSFSTHTKIKKGGYQGRPLLKNDVLPLNSTALGFPIKTFPNLSGLISAVYQSTYNIRCIGGPEWDLVDDRSKAVFSQLPFSITAQSDRMGYRLKGPELSLCETVELISSPVDYGTIQLIPSGQLIILMADHQTTGGYPRIAQVINADLPRLAQSPVHSELHFEMIAVENAADALFSLYQTHAFIAEACKKYYDVY